MAELLSHNSPDVWTYLVFFPDVEVSLKWGDPTMDGLIIMENPMKMHDFGVPLFQKPPCISP